MKIIVGISGGVDSSVAALLLKQQGHEVIGVFMKNWQEEDDDENCSSAMDYQDALRVCQKIGIPLKTINFSQAYMDRVFKVSLHMLQKGMTPNPDILCNQEIKFKCFFDACLNMQADYIATGHYARIQNNGSSIKLLRAIDYNKDQTYFLYTLSQKILSKIIFPIGELPKEKVRSIAQQAQLSTHNKKDSTGICFIGERNFKEFIGQYILKSPGDIVDTYSKKLGQHDGLSFYTIGQRAGLNIGGKKGYQEKPWYVLKKDLVKNQLIVGQDHNHPLLMHHELICTDVHWINPKQEQQKNYSAKIRYRQQDGPCSIQILNNKKAKVIFEEPQRAITPGQAIVFYNNNECLGGATISATNA